MNAWVCIWFQRIFFVLISTDLPQALKIVIPEEILIGNPAFNWLKSWIPDKGIRG